MSPSIAACLCVTLILALFYRNSKRYPQASAGLWVATLWVGIISSRPVSFWLNGNHVEADFSAYLDGHPIDRNVFLALLALGIVILIRRRVNWGNFFGKNRWLVLFYLYCCVSVVWSDDPFVALKRWTKDVGNIVMALIILTEEDPVVGIHQVFMRCTFLMIPLSLLFMKYYPELGTQYNEWTGEPCYCGVSTGKNQLGRLAMLSGLFLIWSLMAMRKGSGWWNRIRGNLPEVIVLVMCVVILIKARSATSLACFMVGVAAFFATRTNWVKANPRLLGWCACGFIMLSVLALTVPDLRKTVAGSLGRNPNLTERTDVWKGVLSLKTNPLIGEGFASFWLTPGARRLAEELRVPHAHNGYLETYLNSGLIGLGLLLGVLFTAGKNVLRQVEAGTLEGPLYAALFLSGVIYNYTEASFNDTSNVAFVLWLVSVQYARSSSVEISTTMTTPMNQMRYT